MNLTALYDEIKAERDKAEAEIVRLRAFISNLREDLVEGADPEELINAIDAELGLET